jgi:hypothetical protein
MVALPEQAIGQVLVLTVGRRRCVLEIRSPPGVAEWIVRFPQKCLELKIGTTKQSVMKKTLICIVTSQDKGVTGLHLQRGFGILLGLKGKSIAE